MFVCVCVRIHCAYVGCLQSGISVQLVLEPVTEAVTTYWEMLLQKVGRRGPLQQPDT